MYLSQLQDARNAFGIMFFTIRQRNSIVRCRPAFANFSMITPCFFLSSIFFPSGWISRRRPTTTAGSHLPVILLRIHSPETESRIGGYPLLLRFCSLSALVRLCPIVFLYLLLLAVSWLLCVPCCRRPTRVKRRTDQIRTWQNKIIPPSAPKAHLSSHLFSFQPRG